MLIGRTSLQTGNKTQGLALQVCSGLNMQVDEEGLVLYAFSREIPYFGRITICHYFPFIPLNYIEVLSHPEVFENC